MLILYDTMAMAVSMNGDKVKREGQPSMLGANAAIIVMPPEQTLCPGASEFRKRSEVISASGPRHKTLRTTYKRGALRLCPSQQS